MDWLVVALATAAGVLVAGGAAKVVSPHAVAVALRHAGLPSSLLTGRLVGAAELVIGSLALTVSGRWIATTLGVTYLALAGLVGLLMGRGVTEPCGCFGAAGAAPRLGHAIADLVLAAVAFGASITGGRSLYDAAVTDPLWGLVMVPVVAALVLMVVIAFGRSTE